MHATHPDWLNNDPALPRRPGAPAGAAAGPVSDPLARGSTAAEGSAASRLAAARVGWLVGLYTVMWLALYACIATHLLNAEAAPEDIPGSFLFLGLLSGQVGSCLLWVPRGRFGQLFQHALAGCATGLGAGLLCHWLGGPWLQWWLGMVVLALGAKAADWAMRQPLVASPTARTHRSGWYSLATWISFSLWVAVLLRLLPGVTQQPLQAALMVAVWGGLSLWIAIHRFAFRQLLDPSDPYWQRQRQPRTGRVLDALGILLILSLLHGLLAVGLWQTYAMQPIALWLGMVCGIAALWQAIDLQFEALVAANVGLRPRSALSVQGWPAQSR